MTPGTIEPPRVAIGLSIRGASDQGERQRRAADAFQSVHHVEGPYEADGFMKARWIDRRTAPAVKLPPAAVRTSGVAE